MRCLHTGCRNETEGLFCSLHGLEEARRGPEASPAKEADLAQRIYLINAYSGQRIYLIEDNAYSGRTEMGLSETVVPLYVLAASAAQAIRFAEGMAERGWFARDSRGRDIEIRKDMLGLPRELPGLFVLGPNVLTTEARLVEEASFLREARDL